MSVEKTEVLVVGAGQAGVAMSEHLGKAAIPHLVLECGQIAERWRSDGGGSALFTGANGLGVTATAQGRDCVAAGDLLANTAVVAAMVKAFEAGPQHFLADRLLAALEAGLAAGGEAGPVHSAGITVHEHDLWPCVDLRVDWSQASPLADLQLLWKRYQPQMQDYVNRAREPEQAPSFGVPSDL